MTLRARLLTDRQGPHSRIRVHPGQEYELTLQVTDAGHPVNWSGRRPRFRIYSQLVDGLVVVEITDPQRCRFEPDGIWKLCLTSEETQSLPRGGMRFTLEHSVAESGSFELGVIGGVSCTEVRLDPPHTVAGPMYAK